MSHTGRATKYFDPLLGYCVCVHCSKLPEFAPMSGVRIEPLQFVRWRHVAGIEVDDDSVRRGGSTRRASCTCGWRGPERATLELACDDALEHE